MATLSKKGFTIFELMVVMALLSIFVVMTVYYMRDSRIPQVKAERLAYVIQDAIATARNNMVIGRGVMSGGTTMTRVDKRKISISTGWVLVQYERAGNLFTETGSEIQYPFFDGDKGYSISNILVSSGTSLVSETQYDQSGALNLSLSILPNGDMSATWVGITSPIKSILILSQYDGFTQGVRIDLRGGIIEIAK